MIFPAINLHLLGIFHGYVKYPEGNLKPRGFGACSCQSVADPKHPKHPNLFRDLAPMVENLCAAHHARAHRSGETLSAANNIYIYIYIYIYICIYIYACL